MGNPAWRSDRHESGLGKPVVHGPGRRADSGDLLLVWLQEQLSLLVVAREAARSNASAMRTIRISGSIDTPGSLERFKKPDISRATHSGHTLCY